MSHDLPPDILREKLGATFAEALGHLVQLVAMELRESAKTSTSGQVLSQSMTTAALQDDWFTVPELANWVKVKAETVRDWIKRGHLKAERLGPADAKRPVYRIRRSEIERFLRPDAIGDVQQAHMEAEAASIVASSAARGRRPRPPRP